MTTSNFMIGPVTDGIRKDVKPYAIANDAFEVLTNAYQWRGRIVRRDGYDLLGRLTQTVTTVTLTSQANGGSAVYNDLLAELPLVIRTLSPNATIVPGTLNITVGGVTYTSSTTSGTLIGSGANTGDINYATSRLSMTFSPAIGPTNVVVTFSYYPDLPVMGLRYRQLYGADNDVSVDLRQLVAFDTKYSYFFDTSSSSFLPLPSFMPVIWNGFDYEFFYTVNYAGALWTTNAEPGLNGVNILSVVPGVGLTTITTTIDHGFTDGQTVFLINIGGSPTNTNNLNGNGFILTVVTSDSFTIPVVATGILTPNGIALNSQVAITGQDGIRYYGPLDYGSSIRHDSWANYNPPVDPNNALCGALLIFPYRGYLVFLNTTEGNDLGTFNYGGRARWTQIGTPYYSLPVPYQPNLQAADPKAARDDLFGRGGANDAPTDELIVGAAFIKDILIVYFERSTWRLRFVNNAQNPFVWERINIELGCDCTFSTIPFDKGLMAIGQRGIVISDGNDVIRFDEKIPDDIFDIRQANNGLNRVCGIRTFRTRLNYWTYPSNTINQSGIYPDQVLVFNYDTKNWSYFDDCFTTFGYFYSSTLGVKWSDLKEAWTQYDKTFASDGATSQGYESIVAGNQQGFVLKLEQKSAQNSESLFISAINTSTGFLTSPNNTLPNKSWVKVTGVIGVTSDDGVSLNGRNFQIANPTNDANTFQLTEFEFVNGGSASGSSYSYTIDFFPILAGSIQINVGALVFSDGDLNGILQGSDGLSTGTVNYSTGAITLAFNTPIGATTVYIRVVSLNIEQNIVTVALTGSYIGGGVMAKISNIDIQTKVFNFFGDDQKSRLSKIDFYVNQTATGQFVCNVFADSSKVPVNTPLKDNPQSNVVVTTQNPYQVGPAPQTIYRLFCDAVAQTVQCQLTLSDEQMAVDAINDADIEIVSMMFTLRRAGRLI